MPGKRLSHPTSLLIKHWMLFSGPQIGSQRWLPARSLLWLPLPSGQAHTLTHRNRGRFRRTYSKSYRPLEKPALTQVYYCTPCLLKFIPQPGRLCTRKFTAQVNRAKCKTAGFWLRLQAKDRHRLWLGVFSQGHWHRMCFQGVFILNKESLYSLRKLLGRKLNLVLLLFRLTLTLAVLLPPPGLG